MVKIQDFFADVSCDLSNQTTQPAHHFFELFNSKHINWAQISSIDRLTSYFSSMTPTIKCFAQGMQKSIFALLLYFFNRNNICGAPRGVPLGPPHGGLKMVGKHQKIYPFKGSMMPTSDFCVVSALERKIQYGAQALGMVRPFFFSYGR